MYQTTVYCEEKPMIEGSQRYIKQMIISERVAETTHHLEVPKTNRGHQKEEGWLGSYTEGNTTKSFYARGLCRLVSSKALVTHDIDENDHTITTPRIFAWELLWEPTAIAD